MPQEVLRQDKRYAGDAYARLLAQRYKNFNIPSPRFYTGIFGYKFLYYLNNPFTEWNAYKKGFIDEKGRELKKQENQKIKLITTTL